MTAVAPTHLEDLAVSDLAGRSVLHVGCGDGTLGRAAREAGARFVVGVPLDPAGPDQSAAPAITALRGLAALGARRFDHVVLSWADRRARLPREVIEATLARTGDDGTLLIDMQACGEPLWSWSVRNGADGTWEAPGRLLFERELLRDTAFRVQREAEGLFPNWRRFLVRVQHWRQDVLLGAAPPQSGKTSLLRNFSERGIATCSLDYVLQQVAAGFVSDDGPFGTFVRERFTSTRIHELVAAIDDDAVAAGGAELLARILPVEPRILMVEGFLLANGRMMAAVLATLSAQGRRCWQLDRLYPPTPAPAQSTPAGSSAD
ncbi:class I SAM-dependent methyltransferase [Alsobacter sp. R-9]